PQFVSVDAPSKVAAFLVLGLLFNVVGTTWNIAVAWFTGRFAASSTSRRLRAWLARAIGALFVGVAIKLALSEQPDSGRAVGAGRLAQATTSPSRASGAISLLQPAAGFA